ncbi:MAG: SH3 domain-containing protein [Brevinemataceae bacterium]
MRIFYLIFFMLSLQNIHSTQTAFEHPNITYNKAVKEYQSGNLPQAMYLSKQAMLTASYNKNIRELFFSLRKELDYPKILTSDSKLNYLFSVIFGKIPPQIDALIGSLLFLTAAVLLSLYFLKKYIHTPKIIPTVKILFVCSILLMTKAMIQYFVFADNKNHRIIISNTSVYEEPSLQSVELFQLSAGWEAEIIDNIDEFVLIKTFDNKEGWIISNSIPPFFQ